MFSQVIPSEEVIKVQAIVVLRADLELFVDNSIGNNIFALFLQKSQYFYCYCYWL